MGITRALALSAAWIVISTTSLSATVWSNSSKTRANRTICGDKLYRSCRSGFVTRSKDERVVQRKISLGEDGIRRVALEYDERVFLGLLVSLR